jgi:uncharacterized membrane protein
VKGKNLGMKVSLTAYLTTLAALFGIDFVWLLLSNDKLYRPILKDILVDGFRPAPAIAFYLVYAAGLVYFAVRPGLASESWSGALLNGALFGFFAYATYDLTNQGDAAKLDDDADRCGYGVGRGPVGPRRSDRRRSDEGDRRRRLTGLKYSVRILALAKMESHPVGRHAARARAGSI